MENPAVRHVFRCVLLHSALVLLVLLGGCAAMTVEECKVARWGEVGLRDGLAGEPLGKLNALVKDCAEAHVAVDTPTYLQGRDQGLLTYCRLDNAPRQGLAGKTYSGACPASIDGEFYRRFAIGREVYDANQQMRGLDGRRVDLENRLRATKEDDAKRRLREDLSDLDRTMRRARDRVRDAEFTLDRLR